jgi:hypothetical protein
VVRRDSPAPRAPARARARPTGVRSLRRTAPELRDRSGDLTRVGPGRRGIDREAAAGVQSHHALTQAEARPVRSPRNNPCGGSRWVNGPCRCALHGRLRGLMAPGREVYRRIVIVLWLVTGVGLA